MDIWIDWGEENVMTHANVSTGALVARVCVTSGAEESMYIHLIILT